MKVLVVEPGYAPYEKDIEGLHGMQEVVGGTITAIYPFAEPVAVVAIKEKQDGTHERNRDFRYPCTFYGEADRP